MTDIADDDAPLDVVTYLETGLDMYDSDLAQKYAPPTSIEDQELETRLEKFGSEALKALHDPAHLREVAREFADSAPWERLEDKLREVVFYQYVHEEAQGAVARSVAWRLNGLRQRLQFALLALTILHKTDPTPTALKYFQQVVDLYLAGFTTPVLVMCGAVLEAAIRDRIPDEALRDRNIRPAFKAANDYSISQRMKLEEEARVLSPDERKIFWGIMNRRNDAVHVQADAGPDPLVSVLGTAFLLSRIQPLI